MAGPPPGLKRSYTADEVRQLMAAPGGKRKYKNIPVSVDGHRFPSKREARRYLELATMQKAGLISELQVHRRWPLVVNGVKIGAYESDFEYVENGAPVVEDAKGVRTRVYALKRKLMLALHGVTIKEV